MAAERLSITGLLEEIGRWTRGRTLTHEHHHRELRPLRTLASLNVQHRRVHGALSKPLRSARYPPVYPSCQFSAPNLKSIASNRYVNARRSAASIVRSSASVAARRVAR